MREITFVVRESGDGGFLACAVGASIFTEGDTLADVAENVRDAVLCHFDDGGRPAAIRLRHAGQETVLA